MNAITYQVDEELKDRLTSATKGFEVSNLDNLCGDDACNVVGDNMGPLKQVLWAGGHW